MRLFWSAVVLSLLSALAYPQNLSQTTSAQQPNQTAPEEKPRVFITDSQSWEMVGTAGGSNGNWGAQTHGGARPQTAEIVKTFGERCPQVMVNNKQSVAEYIVVLDHEGGKGVLRHKNKVAVFEALSGDVVISHSTLSLGGSVQDACDGIVKHWTEHSAQIRAGESKQSVATAQPSSPLLRLSLLQPPPVRPRSQCLPRLKVQTLRLMEVLSGIPHR